MVGQRRRHLRPGTASRCVLAAPLTAQVVAAQPASAAGLSLSVDLFAARHAISPDIYGMNGGDPALVAELGTPVSRWGGNASSRCNFENHTYNTGSDWYFENIVAGPDNTLEAYVRRNRDHGIKQVVTVPMSGWVAKDVPEWPHACGFPATRFPAQDSFDQWDANCGNGRLNNANLTGAEPTDTSIPADASFAGAEVSHLVSQFGTAAHGGVPIYELDNEPVLWSSTHLDVHPRPVSDEELGSKSTATATAIESADPRAAVLGPSGWGYREWIASGVDGCAPGADAAAHGGLNLSQWFLENMKDASGAAGKRLLDYFDQHYYPQIGGDKTPEADALRLRSTRSLWDPSYVEESWIGPSGVNAPPLQFIRTMKRWIAQYNPARRPPSPNTTGVPWTTSTAHWPKPTSSASSAAKASTWPPSGASRNRRTRPPTRSGCTATTTAPEESSATSASRRPAPTRGSSRSTALRQRRDPHGGQQDGHRADLPAVDVRGELDHLAGAAAAPLLTGWPVNGRAADAGRRRSGPGRRRTRPPGAPATSPPSRGWPGTPPPARRGSAPTPARARCRSRRRRAGSRSRGRTARASRTRARRGPAGTRRPAGRPGSVRAAPSRSARSGSARSARARSSGAGPACRTSPGRRLDRPGPSSAPPVTGRRDRPHRRRGR
ncbi:Uncharacterised protein [Amycolatopsis camponoti]|uniref:Glycoside hydrolase family 44 catalytic domain-containing protein n=1 Tax=Amycolatopsis camponoti TaxID=2606593 RepID=A0A6I8LJ64_9PSEU|nr:Uncharacterised protein [Amycolatopsis camponoti]